MLKEKRRNDKIKGKIEEILRTASQRSEISQRTSEMIDHWMLDHENDSDHKEVLGELFNEDFSLSHKPSREAKEALQRVKIRLGMDTAVKIPLYRKTYFRIASAAAVVLVLVGISLTMTQKETEHPVQFAARTVEVIDGVQKDLTLADGTQVWVNSSSKLTYPEGFGDERCVSLSGEAYFDVQSDKAHPFIVQTEHLTVKVLGTQFDIAEHPEAGYTEVSLFEGSVQVILNAGRSQTLVPGEKLTLDHSTNLSTVSPLELDATNDWRSDVIFADNRTMPELLGMIANYYDVRIEFDAAQFADSLTYSAGFGKQDSLTKVLGVLSDISGGFSYQQRDGSIYITRQTTE